MRYRILTLNDISPRGLEHLPRERYEVAAGLAHPHAVLVRAAELLDVDPPGAQEVPRWLRGPGNLTRALSITGDDDGRDCCAPGARVTWASSSLGSGVIGCSARVGLSRARERLSRYYLEGSAALSAPPRRARS
jgi:3-methyladenine DNA glycosylase Mpg